MKWQALFSCWCFGVPFWFSRRGSGILHHCCASNSCWKNSSVNQWPIYTRSTVRTWRLFVVWQVIYGCCDQNHPCGCREIILIWLRVGSFRVWIIRTRFAPWILLRRLWKGVWCGYRWRTLCSKFYEEHPLMTLQVRFTLQRKQEKKLGNTETN